MALPKQTGHCRTCTPKLGCGGLEDIEALVDTDRVAENAEATAATVADEEAVEALAEGKDRE